MEDEDTKANFDRLAKVALLELCSEHQGHGPRRGIRESLKEGYFQQRQRQQ